MFEKEDNINIFHKATIKEEYFSVRCWKKMTFFSLDVIQVLRELFCYLNPF